MEDEKLELYCKEYINFMNKRNRGNYSIDGPINIDKWNKSRYKILFVLKETRGYQNRPIFKLQEELKNVWLKFKKGETENPTYKNVAWLAKSLQIALEKDRILTKVEVENLDTTSKSLIEAIDYCAIINIKKYSNSSPDGKSNDKDIRSEFCANRELLEWQTKTLSPNVIVAGSTVVWECLSSKINGLYKDIITSDLKVHECKSFNGIVFYHAYHPSAPREYKWDIQKIHKQLFEEIKRTL